MKILLSLLAALFLSSEAAPQQNISGTVKYKTEAFIPYERFANLKDSDPQRYRQSLAYCKKIAEAVEQIEYTLIFNDNAALFKAEEMLSKDSDMVAFLQESGGTYYNSISGEKVQQIEDQGRSYRIVRKNLEWEITGETKQIGSYTCRKAVSNQNFFSHRTNENQVQEIEAWFTPDIPASFGPKGYSGLPGLILDLTVAQEHFYATEIKLNTTEAEITKPSKGKKVSFEEYQAIRAGLGEKFKEFHGN